MKIGILGLLRYFAMPATVALLVKHQTTDPESKGSKLAAPWWLKAWF